MSGKINHTKTFKNILVNIFHFEQIIMHPAIHENSSGAHALDLKIIYIHLK